MRRELVALLALVAGCKGKPAADEEEDELPVVTVTCAPVARTAVEDALDVDGVIAPPPKHDASLSSPVAGRVSQLSVEEGDKVAAGAVLATIEDPALPAGSIEARAGVASARAASEAAALDLARQQRLVDQGIGARRDLEEARAKAAAAAAELEAANARSGLAARQSARAQLRAPFAGVVLHVYKRAGESVDGTAATPVVEIADLGVLEVRAQVAPASLVKLKEGMPAHVRVAGIADDLPATVARVAPAVDPTTLLGSVRIQLSATANVPVGSAATARIVIGTHEGLVVPATALRRSQLGSDELVTCKDGTAHVRAVTLGTRGATSIEVTAGLTAGESIVVDKALGIEEGQKLGAPEPGEKAARGEK